MRPPPYPSTVFPEFPIGCPMNGNGSNHLKYIYSAVQYPGNVLKKRCLPKFEKFHKTILYNGFALPVPPID